MAVIGPLLFIALWRRNWARAHRGRRARPGAGRGRLPSVLGRPGDADRAASHGPVHRVARQRPAPGPAAVARPRGCLRSSPRCLPQRLRRDLRPVPAICAARSVRAEVAVGRACRQARYPRASDASSSFQEPAAGVLPVASDASSSFQEPAAGALRVASDAKLSTAGPERAYVRLAYFTLLGALLLATTWFQAWYMVWPFAVGAALPEGQQACRIGSTEPGRPAAILRVHLPVGDRRLSRHPKTWPSRPPRTWRSSAPWPSG